MEEISILEAIGRMETASAALQPRGHAGLDEAAKLIQDEAKREIGNYQDAAGPFAAWAQLAESTLAEKERLGFAPPDNPLLRVGDLRDSIERAVGEHEAVIGSNNPVAVYQELGVPENNLPARSFLGGAAFREAPKVAHILGKSVVMALVGDAVPGGALDIGG